jgi:hypothetical protein
MKGRVPKYRNTRVKVDGITFDSKREAARYGQLLILQGAGQISDLERQVKIPLHGRDGPILTPTGRQMHYVADFRYVDNMQGGAVVVEDAKGFETPEFKLKRAILAAQGVKIVLS